jgi:TetR/AcrR family transcriptional regulator, transcriptional repressor for nem operon
MAASGGVCPQFWSIAIIQMRMSGIIHVMGHSRDDKARSHERIVEIAAARLRESGTAGPGVAELMKAAGLTHGGFYKHFGSRDDLVAEAVERALRDNEGFMTTLTAGAADAHAALRAFVDWYTSAEHRDAPGAGCAVVAFGADAPRADERVRTAYTGQVQRYLMHLEALLGDRRRAAAALSTLVGAVLVARGVGPGELSDEILARARESVLAMAPGE